MFEKITLEKAGAISKPFLYWGLFIVILIPVTSQSGASLSKYAHAVFHGIAGSFIALLIIWIFNKSEKKSLSAYGLIWKKNTFTKFMAGFGIGISSFALIILLFIVFAKVQININPNAFNSWTLYWYLTIIPAVLMEEIAFRSYPFLKLNNVLGLRIAQIITAVAFALYHIVFGWNIGSAFLGPGVWSFVFGIVAIRSGGIAVPTGIHFGLNLLHAMIGTGKSHAEPIWIVSNGEQVSTVSLIIQLLILIVGITLTELHLRDQKRLDLRAAND
jgi:uncharacterized protein